MISAGNMDRVYKNQQVFQDFNFRMKLPHVPVIEEVDPVSGRTVLKGLQDRVVPGAYSQEFTIPIDHGLPSSSIGLYNKMRYRIIATLVRASPSSNVQVKQRLWVLNSKIPAPELNPDDEDELRQRGWSTYSGVFDRDIRYQCSYPWYSTRLGYKVPIWFRLESIDRKVEKNRDTVAAAAAATAATVTTVSVIGSTAESQLQHQQALGTRDPSPQQFPQRMQSEGRKFKVSGATAQLDEKRVVRSANGYQHSMGRKIFRLDILKEHDHCPIHAKSASEESSSNDEPKSSANKTSSSTRWQRLILVDLPNIWTMNPDSRTRLITTWHILKVKIDIKFGFLHSLQLEYKIPLIVQVPRPPSCPSNKRKLLPSVVGH
ncbi:hypothetical protein BGZ83_004389 [Gryganskiella cystojenkinii]|nr:hypothetical protein BGZ83_004389 [Gryganskiella cystojenkinii]